jgi:hypothetical protein
LLLGSKDTNLSFISRAIQPGGEEKKDPARNHKIFGWFVEMTKKIASFSIFILIFLTSAGCSARAPLPTVTPSPKIYLVDPVFREFYNYLGGREVLGDPISPVSQSGTKRYQYTMGAIMIFDQQAPANRRFQLGPIGKELGIDTEAGTNFSVAGAFLQFYNRLGGENLVGRPITGLLFNEKSRNYEQFFENLGFYQGEQSGGSIRLLQYGAWQCGDFCKESILKNNILLMPTPTKTFGGGAASTAHPNDELILEVWVGSPTIEAGQEQEIGVNLLRNDRPLQGVIPRLVIYFPTGSISYELPLTKVDGSSSILLPPAEVPNNTVVPFKVCIVSGTDRWVCVKDSYLIWNSS